MCFIKLMRGMHQFVINILIVIDNKIKVVLIIIYLKSRLLHPAIAG
jgi:hypothetical protein